MPKNESHPFSSTLGSNSASLHNHWNANQGNQERWSQFSIEVIDECVNRLHTRPTLFDLYSWSAQKRYDIGEELGHNEPQRLQAKELLSSETIERISRLKPNSDTYGVMREQTNHHRHVTDQELEEKIETLNDDALRVFSNRLVTRITHIGKYEDQLAPLCDQLVRLIHAKTLDIKTQITQSEAFFPIPDSPNKCFKKQVDVSTYTFFFGGKMEGWSSDIARYATVRLYLTPPRDEYIFPPTITIEHMSSDLIEQSFDEVEPLWQKLLDWDGQNLAMFTDQYHQLMWHLAQMSPLCRGSAAASNWVLQGLRAYHHLKFDKTPMQEYLPGVSWDLIAILTENPKRFSQVISWLYPIYDTQASLPQVEANKIYEKMLIVLEGAQEEHFVDSKMFYTFKSQLKSLNEVWFLTDEAKVQQLLGLLESFEESFKPESFKHFKAACAPDLMGLLCEQGGPLIEQFKLLSLSSSQKKSPKKDDGGFRFKFPPK